MRRYRTWLGLALCARVMDGGQWCPSAMRRSLDVCEICRRVSRDLRRFPDVRVIVCRASRVGVVRFCLRCPLLGVCPCLDLLTLGERISVAVLARLLLSSSPPSAQLLDGRCPLISV